MSSQLVFHLNEATKSLAFQLKAFLDTGHQYTRDRKVFPEAGVRIAICITSLYLRPAHLRGSIETVGSSRRTERSSASAEPASFNIDWAIDRSLFQAAVNSFAQGIQQFRTSETYLAWHNQQYPTTPSSTSIDRSRTGFTEEVTITNPQDVMAASFTEAQQEALNRIIAESVSRTIRKLSNQGGLPPEPLGPPGPTGSTGLAGDDDENDHRNRWNPTEVGFFDPMYNDKSMHTDDPLKHSGKETYFRDVHLFIERIKDILHIKDANLVRTNL